MCCSLEKGIYKKSVCKNQQWSFITTTQMSSQQVVITIGPPAYVERIHGKLAEKIYLNYVTLLLFNIQQKCSFLIRQEGANINFHKQEVFNFTLYTGY